MEPVSKVLQKALDSFGEEGGNWIKGLMYEDNNWRTGRFCSLGAVARVCLRLESNRYRDCYPEACKFLYSSVVAENERGIAEFNDKPSTKFSDIKRIFNRAIECAKAHEQLEDNRGT